MQCPNFGGMLCIFSSNPSLVFSGSYMRSEELLYGKR
jgi:hypothetical protein